MAKISHFQQLEVWQEAHKLVLKVYQVTKDFPGDERFGLVSQMRRAAVSVPANIVEGFKRHGKQEKIRFYNIAEGSLEELKYFFILGKDLGYISSNDDLISQAESVGRLLNGLITSARNNL
ncbi:MAG: four helix bundle protein [Dehalococcoidia bacterium]|nr:MAG: four helix bundle protein [Dehalococcoidia bacterium]